MAARKTTQGTASSAAIALPAGRIDGGKSLEDCLRARRSCRSFRDEPLALERAADLLWAAQGITGLGGLRTAPSAGALYPLHLYLLAFEVATLRPGAYAYDPDQHMLSLWKAGDLRARVWKGAAGQDTVETAPLAILLAAAYGRSEREFGDRATRLVHIEAGHIGQNVLLAATALELGAVGFSRLDEAAMRKAVDLPAGEDPVYLLLAGVKE